MRRKPQWTGSWLFNQTIRVGSTLTRRTTFIFNHIFILMIKLKSILKEGFDNELSSDTRGYSWLKPDGTFVPVKYSHDSDAYNIRFRSLKNEFDPKDDHTLELWKLGWQRITNSKYLKSIYANNDKFPPNTHQMKSLKDLAIEINADKIEWDRDGIEKILWSSNDTLQEHA